MLMVFDCGSHLVGTVFVWDGSDSGSHSGEGDGVDVFVDGLSEVMSVFDDSGVDVSEDCTGGEVRVDGVGGEFHRNSHCWCRYHIWHVWVAGFDCFGLSDEKFAVMMFVNEFLDGFL